MTSLFMTSNIVVRRKQWTVIYFLHHEGVKQTPLQNSYLRTDFYEILIWWRPNSKLSKSLRNITLWPLWRHLSRHQCSKAAATLVLPQVYTRPHAAVGQSHHKESLRRTKNIFLIFLSFIWCIMIYYDIESIRRDTLYSLFLNDLVADNFEEQNKNKNRLQISSPSSVFEKLV